MYFINQFTKKEFGIEFHRCQFRDVANKKKPLAFSQTVDYDDPNSTDINSESNGIALKCFKLCAIRQQSPKIKTIQSLIKTERHHQVVPCNKLKTFKHDKQITYNCNDS